MKKISLPMIMISAVLLPVLGGIALAAQDRSMLKIPDGLAFSEFRGYEDWRPIAASQVKDGIKIISGNDAVINAYRAGVPGNGRAFPEGSKFVKIEWSQAQNTQSPYFVMMPQQLMSVSFIEKDSKRFPKTHGWAYAQFVVDPATGDLKPNGTGAECGYACHTIVANQDYIWTAYRPR
jgi:hypothetical protein